MNIRRAAAAVAVAITLLAGGTVAAEAKGNAPSWAPKGYKACATEDSAGPCYWDASKRGNRKGLTFYVRKSGTVVYAADKCVVAAYQAKFRLVSEDSAVKVCVSTVRTDADAKRAYRYAAVRAIG
jgi:hypothetical protein